MRPALFALALLGLAGCKTNPPCEVYRSEGRVNLECAKGFQCRSAQDSNSLVVICVAEDEADAGIEPTSGEVKL